MVFYKTFAKGTSVAPSMYQVGMEYCAEERSCGGPYVHVDPLRRGLGIHVSRTLHGCLRYGGIGFDPVFAVIMKVEVCGKVMTRSGRPHCLWTDKIRVAAILTEAEKHDAFLQLLGEDPTMPSVLWTYFFNDAVTRGDEDTARALVLHSSTNAVRRRAFETYCMAGALDPAKTLVLWHAVDPHAHHDQGFRWARAYSQHHVMEWLLQLGGVQYGVLDVWLK